MSNVRSETSIYGISVAFDSICKTHLHKKKLILEKSFYVWFPVPSGSGTLLQIEAITRPHGHLGDALVGASSIQQMRIEWMILAVAVDICLVLISKDTDNWIPFPQILKSNDCSDMDLF